MIDIRMFLSPRFQGVVGSSVHFPRWVTSDEIAVISRVKYLMTEKFQMNTE